MNPRFIALLGYESLLFTHKIPLMHTHGLWLRSLYYTKCNACAMHANLYKTPLRSLRHCFLTFDYFAIASGAISMFGLGRNTMARECSVASFYTRMRILDIELYMQAPSFLYTCIDCLSLMIFVKMRN